MKNTKVAPLGGRDVEFAEASGTPCSRCRSPRSQPLAVVGEVDMPDMSGIFVLCEECCRQMTSAWKLYWDQRLADRQRVSRVVVLAARRRATYPVAGREKLMPSELPASYEFALVDGHLPGEDVGPGATDQDLQAAAVVAASSAGVAAVPELLEPVYLGYAPDGALCRVFAAGAWARAAGDPAGPVAWVPWPMREGLGPGSRGIGTVLDEVWAARVVNLAEWERGPCCQLGEAAARFLELDARRRADPGEDASMLPAYRLGMTGVEVAVADEVCRRRDVEALASREAAAVPGGAEEAGAEDGGAEEGDARGDETDSSGDDAVFEEDGEEGEAGEGPRPGFAR